MKAIGGIRNAVQRDDEIDLRALLGSLIDRKWLIIAAGVLFFLLGLAYVLVVTPVYQATAMIQVEQAPNTLQTAGAGGQAIGASNPAAADAEAILTSQSVIGSAVGNLNLNIVISPYRVPLLGGLAARHKTSGKANAPWFGLRSYGWGGSRLNVPTLEVPDDLLGESLTLTAGSDDSFTLRQDSAVPFSRGQLLLRGRVGQVVSEAGITMLVSKLQANSGMRFHVQRNTQETTIDRLQKSVTTGQPSPGSNIISLGFYSKNPQMAVDVLDQMTKAFLVQNVGRNSAQASGSLQFVQKQQAEVKKKLENAQFELNAFQRETHALDVPMQTQSMLGEIAAINSNIGQLNTQKVQVQRLYTTGHPAYKAVMRQIAQMEAQKASIEAQMNTMPDAQRKLLRLNGNVEVLNNTYNSLLNEGQQLELAQAGTVGTARIVDAPSVDITKPAKPKKLVTVLGCGFVGGFLAVGFVLLQQTMRRGVEDPSEIEQLGVPVYSAIPLSDQQIELSQRRPRLLGKGRSPLLALAAPDDLAAEAMRSLRTSLRYNQIGASDNRLMICGSSAQAGKTFVSANLAAVNAQAGLKVLLIDADMRAGNLHRMLGVPSDDGLSELLAGEIKVSDAIYAVPGLENLHLIPGGAKPSNPSELLMRPAFGVLLRRLSPEYDLVIIDSPPILAVTDAAIIGHHVGTSLLVVRFGLNQSREVELAMERFRQNGVTVQGVVFNGVEQRSGGFYNYGSTGYGLAP